MESNTWMDKVQESKPYKVLCVVVGHLVDYSFLLIIPIGILLVIITNVFEDDSYPRLWDSVHTIGVSILFGGVMGSFFRYMKVSKFIEEEFNNCMYSQRFLKEPSNYRRALDNVLQASISNYLPHMKDELKVEHLKKFLPQEPDLVYKTYEQDFIASWADKEETIIRIEEMCTLTLMGLNSKKSFVHYEHDSPKINGFTPHIVTLRMRNNASAKYVDIHEKFVRTKETIDRRETWYDIPIEGSEEYTIIRNMERFVSIYKEPYTMYQALRYQMNTKVKLKSTPKNLIADFISFGTADEFNSDVGKDRSTLFIRSYNQLLMKGSGYVIYFDKEVEHREVESGDTE
jgi:hypothetical protein